MTHFTYEEIVLDQTSVPKHFYDQSEQQNRQEVVDSFYLQLRNRQALRAMPIHQIGGTHVR